MSVIDSTEEKKKLVRMYAGDTNRDATYSIRGFLFQDYVTIRSLLRNNVEYVCSEFLEDVDIFFEDKTDENFEYIQVKYYPHKKPDMCEIATDLYYQHLRLKMLQSNLAAVPRLYIHREGKVEKPTLEDMKWYMGFENDSQKRKDAESKAQKQESEKDENQENEAPKPKLRATAAYPKDPADWLTKEVYPLKKEKQKKKLFAAAAAEDTLEEFLEKFDIEKQDCISDYKTKLMEDLGERFLSASRSVDENWQLMLLGVALSYVQQRYLVDKPKAKNLDEGHFDKLRISRTAFEKHVKNTLETNQEQKVASYLVGLITGEYQTIIDNNTFDELQTAMLNRIYQNTVWWIKKICAMDHGPYQLLNTFSSKKANVVAAFRTIEDYDEKVLAMAKCERDIERFVDYLWKIMMNICQARVKEVAEIEQNADLFDPDSYTVWEVESYICLKFPTDSFGNHTVILPEANKVFDRVKSNVVGRMVQTPNRPKKWFFQNDGMIRGKNYYNYSTAAVYDAPTVADLENDDDVFYIECMDCICIDNKTWNKPDPCGDCIFALKCAKEEKQE